MDEPNALIRWTIFVFAGGYLAIVGKLIITVIVMMSFYPGSTLSFRPFSVANVIAIGLIFIVCGSSTDPFWFQFVTLLWLAAVIVKLIARKRSSPLTTPVNPTITIGNRLWFLSPFAWLITATVIELPWQIWSAPAVQVSHLIVIADSVTAGLNDGEVTWPRQLSHRARVDVFDASQPGATLQSALKQNSRLGERTGLVVLEIGGNDMLEGLPVAKFEQDLDVLLAEVAQPGRTIIMFELPLPPLSASYGIAQRRQAARHQIHLIPKRRFVNLLTTSGATVDGIHLSKRGQSQMTDLIQSLLAERLEPGIGSYQRFE